MKTIILQTKKIERQCFLKIHITESDLFFPVPLIFKKILDKNR